MKFISSVVALALANACISSAVEDIYEACQAHWCTDDYWRSQCLKTCGGGNDSTSDGSTGNGNCEDIFDGCQAHWCTDSYWASQCLRTCNACGNSGGGSGGNSSTTPSPTNSSSNYTPTNSPITNAPTNANVASPTPRPTMRPLPVVDIPTNKKFVMYYPSWATYGRNFQIADMKPEKITHINYAFANIANGECVLGDSYADTEKFFAATDSWNDPNGTLRGNFNQMIKMKKQYPHVKTLISIGGWTWSTHFSDVASTAAKREKFVNSCVKFMKDYQFDGIDVDWEFPVEGGNNIPHRPEDKENYTLLMQQFREKLDEDGQHHPLTIAVSADPNKVKNLEVANLNGILDWINVMSYDFNGAWNNETGHNAPLYLNMDAGVPEFNCNSAVEEYLQAGLAPAKLILGVGFYGRGWSNVEPNDASGALFAPANGASPGTWEAGVLDYSDIIENYENKNGYTKYWDDVSKVPYLYNPQKRTFITYDDKESMCYKSGYINKHNLGGAMVWEASSDYNYELQDLVWDVVVVEADACNL